MADHQHGADTGAFQGERMAQAMHHARLPLIITNAAEFDNPIIFANKAFCDLTGYTPGEVLGRNCRFLQGDATTPESIEQVREVIRRKAVDTIEIVNYRKDGSKFLNALQIGPILDDDGETKFFFGSQLDITERRAAENETRELAERELIHRFRNIVNVMSVIIRMTGREASVPAEFNKKITERLHALSEAHFRAMSRSAVATPSLVEVIGGIMTAYAPHGPKQFELSGEDRSIPAQMISPITLAVHELATNAVKHGALGADAGRVVIDWTFEEDEAGSRLHLGWTEQGGPEVIAPERDSGSGIIRSLVRGEGGELDYDWRKQGLVAHMVLPFGP